MASFYPTLVTDKFVDTINFYEDFFGFAPSTEEEGYALLEGADDSDHCIAVFDRAHKCIAQLEQSVQGVILTFAVDNIEEVYNRLYLEGLEFYKEFGQDVHGDRHFVIYDPNGVLVNVKESGSAAQRLAA